MTRVHLLNFSLTLLGFAAPFLSADALFASTVASEKARFQKEFITDIHVRKQVRFWESIFQRYDASSVVIHDVEEPLAMIDVINFGKYVLPTGDVTTIASSDQTDLVKRYIDRYNIAVDRFKQFREKAVTYGPIEQRMFDVYQRDPATLAKLYRGDVKLRGQAGLSDTFIAAAQRAQEYLPYMEREFKKQGLPVQLTRLPFVESMFNLSARSKVGASGIWQFMPGTAREYMAVNTLVDERNSPYKATHAAARLLQTNYKELGSWPLAVTAYNHGRGGMQRATRELGTGQLGKIITSYRSPTFGFASKNFYAEFVAAVNSYEKLIASDRLKKTPLDLNFDHVVLLKPISVRDLSSKTKLSYSQISKLNPCMNAVAFSSRSNTPLPANYMIRVSKTAANELKKMRLASSIQPVANSRISRR